MVTGLKLLHMGGLERGLTKAALALMPCLENNPVLAAYGAVRSGATQQVAGAGSAAGADGAHGGAEAAACTAGAAAEGAIAEAAAEAAPAVEAVQAAAGAAAPSAGEGAAGSLAGTDKPNVAADAAVPPGLQQMDVAAGGSRGAAVPAAMLATAGSAEQRAERAAAEAVLAEYLRSQRQPNQYGYLPIAQEWDIWYARFEGQACPHSAPFSPGAPPWLPVFHLPLPAPTTAACGAPHVPPCCCCHGGDRAGLNAEQLPTPVPALPSRRVHPSSPADLGAAGVSHGSAAALVTQVCV